MSYSFHIFVKHFLTLPVIFLIISCVVEYVTSWFGLALCHIWRSEIKDEQIRGDGNLDNVMTHDSQCKFPKIVLVDIQSVKLDVP